MDKMVSDKKRKGSRLKWFVVLMLIFVLAGQIYIVTSATPTAPVLLVNPTLKQCITVRLADECYSCRPKEGWEISQTGQCPSTYKIITYGNDMPLNCVEYPRNNWAACSWGRYPTITPEFSGNPIAPDLTAAVQQLTAYPLASLATPTAAAIRTYSFDYLFFLCLGFFIIGITILGVIFVLLRKKKI